MKPIQTIIEIFRQNGRKITPQRRLILEQLISDDSHPTAEQIYQRVKAVMPDVSRTTVYNTLRELVEIGELAPVEDLSENGLRYDIHTENHHHLFCINCHKLIDLKRDFEGLELPSEEASGYQIVKSQVTFYGYCADCKKQPIMP